jgi:hypothetical protein
MFAQEPGINTLNTIKGLSENPQSGRTYLYQWPIKINKVPSTAPYFHKAHLLISADCVAYAYDNFRHSLSNNEVLVIGCPDLEIAEITLKLTEILRQNDILRTISLKTSSRTQNRAEILLSQLMGSQTP